MKICIKPLRVAFIAALFATLFLAAQSAPIHAQGWSVITPFNARVQGTIAIYQEPSSWEVEVEGGRVTGLQTVTIEQVFQIHWVYPTADPNVYLVKYGRFEWIDARGYMINGIYSGYLVWNNLGYYDIHGQFSITGGAGPYEYAHGTGQAWGKEGGYWGNNNPEYGLFDLFLAGTISWN